MALSATPSTRLNLDQRGWDVKADVDSTLILKVVLGVSAIIALMANYLLEDAYPAGSGVDFFLELFGLYVITVAALGAATIIAYFAIKLWKRAFRAAH